MKNKYKEKHNLPLSFKYIETLKTTNLGKVNSKIVYRENCEKYVTDFYLLEKPVKPLTRLL